MNLIILISLMQTAVLSYDMVVIGSGLAGVSTTLEASLNNPNLKILILEKEKFPGGNSMKATSGINLLNTPLQNKEGVQDTFNQFYDDTIKSGKGLSNHTLVKTLISESQNAFDWLTQLGVELTQLTQLGGHSQKRTHKPHNLPTGNYIVSTLLKKIKENPNVELKTEACVIELLDNGVIYEHNGDQHTIQTKAVVLATGGFSHDNTLDSLLKEFAPYYLNFPTTNGPQAEGRGIKIARKFGATLVDMDQIQLHPTSFVDMSDRFKKNKILAPEILRGQGGILVNQQGERFCNELGTRDYVTREILKQTQSDQQQQIEAIIILNEEAVQAIGSMMNFYIGKKLLNRYENGTELAKAYNLNADNLQKTMDKYGQEKVDEFGKSVFETKFDFNNVVYGGVVTPAIHYTMGGLKINEKGQVMKGDSPIEGLYGAGEVTGGVHGGNRLGANSLMECVVFGRIVGREASLYVQKARHDL